MVSTRKTKALNLAGASRQYLAQKSEREIGRLLHLRGGRDLRRKRSGRRLNVSWFWQKWEIGLLGKHLDAEVGRRTGRSVLAVSSKRRKLRIVMVNGPHKPWRDWERKMLGTCSDRECARRTGRTVFSVSSMRRYLGIKGFGAPCGRPRWSQKDIDMLGKIPDDEVARRTVRNRDAVGFMRRKLGIERFGGRLRRWTRTEDKLLRLGRTDEEIAVLTNRTVQGVKARRQLLGISASPPRGRSSVHYTN